MDSKEIYVGNKPALKMSHAEFVKKYNKGEVFLFVDRLGATYFCMGKRKYIKIDCNDIILWWTGFFGFIFSVICSFLYAWYIFIFGYIWYKLFANLSRQARANYVLRDCLESAETYDLIIQQQWGYVLSTDK